MSDSSRKHFNISVVLGNGFDLGILSAIGKSTNELTTYHNYFQWLTNRHFDPANIVYKKMQELKAEGYEDWAALETLIENILLESAADEAVISQIDVIRQQFTLFINEMVTANDLLKVSQLSEANRLGKNTFGTFNGDLANEGRRLKFFNDIRKLNHNCYNWVFLNLNYTAIAENYFHFVHDPHPYQKSTNNFIIIPRPKTNKKWRPYTELSFEFHHPHGRQDVYQSLLLGTSSINLNSADSWRYEKHYVGRLDERYGKFVDETDLFIIFGCSLSRADKFWWQKIICQMLEKETSEAVLYAFDRYESEEDIIQNFITDNIPDTSPTLCDDDLVKLRERFLVKKFDNEHPLKYGFAVGMEG